MKGIIKLIWIVWLSMGFIAKRKTHVPVWFSAGVSFMDTNQVNWYGLIDIDQHCFGNSSSPGRLVGRRAPVAMNRQIQQSKSNWTCNWQTNKLPDYPSELDFGFQARVPELEREENNQRRLLRKLFCRLSITNRCHLTSLGLHLRLISVILLTNYLSLSGISILN